MRNPDQLSVAVQLRYNLSSAFHWNGPRIELAAFCFNAFNLTAANSLNAQYNPRTYFANASARQSPLDVELFFRVRNF